MPFWLSKPLYEFLPYFYVLVGALLAGASRYLDDGNWRALCLALAFACIAAGVVVWWRRRVYRSSR